jgi:tRNA(Ile)-lysidine synthase
MLDKIEAFAEKHHMFPSEGTILAAVSGGADSVCLLAALLELKDKFGFSVAAAHFDHRLRGAESDRDALFVGRLCRDLNVTLYTGSADVGGYARENGLGGEEAARRLRYDFFYETGKKSGAVRIATAHTADDNAETILFHLTRGAGLRGLGGIPPVHGHIIRPMLAVTREEVLFFLSGRSLTYVEDSSNADEKYSRNLIRRRVIPVLKQIGRASCRERVCQYV